MDNQWLRLTRLAIQEVFRTVPRAQELAWALLLVWGPHASGQERLSAPSVVTSGRGRADASGPIASATEMDFDIPAQPLDTALVVFARASGVDVLNDNVVTAGRHCAGVKGVFTPFEALQRVLAGTGLKARYVSPRAAVIVAAPVDDSPDPTVRDSTVLSLSTLEVRETLPRIGGRQFTEYADVVRTRIQQHLRAMKERTAPRFTASVKVWIGSEGNISRIEWHRGSGDATTDRAIELRLLGAHVTVPPSPEMQQPLRFEVRME